MQLRFNCRARSTPHREAGWPGTRSVRLPCDKLQAWPARQRQPALIRRGERGSILSPLAAVKVQEGLR
jgi:hypothetical protein